MLAFSLYVFRYNKFIYPISLSSESRYRTPRYARPLSGRVPPLSDLLLPSFTYISVSPLWLCCEYGKRFSTVSETTTNQHPAVHEGCRDTLTSVMVFTKGHGGGGDPIALLLGFLLDPIALRLASYSKEAASYFAYLAASSSYHRSFPGFPGSSSRSRRFGMRQSMVVILPSASVESV